jgi:hypothetical protein
MQGARHAVEVNAAGIKWDMHIIVIIEATKIHVLLVVCHTSKVGVLSEETAIADGSLVGQRSMHKHQQLLQALFGKSIGFTKVNPSLLLFCIWWARGFSLDVAFSVKASCWTCFPAALRGFGQSMNCFQPDPGAIHCLCEMDLAQLCRGQYGIFKPNNFISFIA